MMNSVSKTYYKNVRYAEKTRTGASLAKISPQQDETTIVHRKTIPNEVQRFNCRKEWKLLGQKGTPEPPSTGGYKEISSILADQ
jgi:hypothetical protein